MRSRALESRSSPKTAVGHYIFLTWNFIETTLISSRKLFSPYYKLQLFRFFATQHKTNVVLQCINYCFYFLFFLCVWIISLYCLCYLSICMRYCTPFVLMVICFACVQYKSIVFTPSDSCIFHPHWKQKFTEMKINFRSHAWVITSIENPFPENTIVCLVRKLLKCCGAHWNAALVNNCRDAFPPLSVSRHT